MWLTTERGRDGEREEGESFPSLLNRRTFGVQSQRGNAFVSQTKKEGRKREEGRGLDDGGGRFGVRAKSH